MATVTTYLLVSGMETPDAVAEHQVLDEHDFEEREAVAPSDERLAARTFAVESPLEDAIDLEDAARRLSADVPEATVVLCEVEERFDQVERLQLLVFRNGKSGGEVEHGYLFNVGPQ